MKTIYSILVCLIIISAGHSQSTKNVLFIGNSYTAYNNMAAMVSTCATSAGDAITFDTHTPGGTTFSQHSANSIVQEKIAQGNWDFVVLQEQSQRPSFPESQVQAQVYPYATQLDSMIRFHNPCAETVFYMTWGRKNGDASNCPTWPPVCTYEGMDSLLNLRYMIMAENNDAIVSPVGAVWNYIRQNFPSIELYNSDESHPSLAGSYAAACCFYATLFRKNPQLITWNSTLNAQDAFNIREAVRIVVFEQMENWFIGEYDVVAEFNIDNNDAPNYYFQNTSNNANTFEWYVNGTLVSNSNDLNFTFESFGEYEITLIASQCGLSAISTQTISYTASSMIQNEDSNVRVFPNPSDNSIFIEIHQAQQVFILDATGRTLETLHLLRGSNSLNLAHYKSGVYVILLENGTSIRFIKN
jgi:hypothetical protein